MCIQSSTHRFEPCLPFRPKQHRVEAVQLSPQEEDDALFFHATGPRAANVPISASPWSPTAAAAAASAASAAAPAAFPFPPARPVYSEQPQQQLEAVGSGSGSVGSSGGGLAPALLDRFVAHIVGQNRQLATANDYRSKADEFVAAWLRPLRVGPARDEEEVGGCVGWLVLVRVRVTEGTYLTPLCIHPLPFSVVPPPLQAAPRVVRRALQGK